MKIILNLHIAGLNCRASYATVLSVFLTEIMEQLFTNKPQPFVADL
jgi:hypothetical protein